MNHTGGCCRAHPAPLPAQARRHPPGPAESAPTQHRRTSWPACCRVAGTGSCWLSKTGPGSPHCGQEPSGHSMAILIQPHWDGENGTCWCPWAPGQQNCWHRKAVPSPALPWEARLGTFNPTQCPKAPRQQLPAVPAPANRPSSSQPVQQALPSSQPGKAAHTPPGKRQPPAGCKFPPPSLRCQARGGRGGLGPALILPMQPCPSTTHHGSCPAAAQALRASQLLRTISDLSTPAWQSTAPTTPVSPPPFPLWTLESAQASLELARKAECGAWHVHPRQSSSPAPPRPCLHGDEGETKHKQGRQLPGHSQAAQASPYCWGTSGGAAVTVCPTEGDSHSCPLAHTHSWHSTAYTRPP